MYRAASTCLEAAAATLEPPVRRSVSESARAVVRVPSAAGAPRPWSPEQTPYMVEPMDLLESRAYQGLVFIGPAQSGKTQALIDCWIGHVITASPSDMMVIQATQSVARDYERDRFRKLKRLSPAIAERLGKGHADNTYDKTLRTGDTIELKWPSENELQGKSRRRMALTDYDRMPLSIGGQGAPFELARKRTRKFLSLGMTLAESSPGHEQSDPKWRPSTPHDAPPAKGIFSLYRQGDRRRLYWPCPHCGEYFMTGPGIDAFQFEAQNDLLGAPIPETLGDVTIACPHCGAVLYERDRPALLARCRWVPDFCTIDPAGVITGTPSRTDIASYWMHGCHAAFSTWRNLVYAYLQAEALYAATGDEEALRTVVMQDLGAPYIARSRESSRQPNELEGRIERAWRRGTVPADVRYLVALVDTQGAYWSVMIVGRGPAGERWLIDRFEIRDSARVGPTGECAPVDPAAYLEDWDLLTEQVVCASYPLIAHPGKRMSVRLTLIDSGGAAKAGLTGVNVTARANQWWRRLRAQGLAHRVALTKGTYAAPRTRAKLVTESYPDTSTRTDRHSSAAGDVPLYLLHVNALKDQLDADLKRQVPGPGYIHFPADLPPALYDELTAEVRTDTGWIVASSGAVRNEAWDQLTMELAAALLPQDRNGLVRERDPHVRFATVPTRINWEAPPVWAGPQTHNSEINRELKPAAVSRETAPRVPPSAPRRSPPPGGFGKEGWGL